MPGIDKKKVFSRILKSCGPCVINISFEISFSIFILVFLASTDTVDLMETRYSVHLFWFVFFPCWHFLCHFFIIRVLPSLIALVFGVWIFGILFGFQLWFDWEFIRCRTLLQFCKCTWISCMNEYGAGHTRIVSSSFCWDLTISLMCARI